MSERRIQVLLAGENCHDVKCRKALGSSRVFELGRSCNRACLFRGVVTSRNFALHTLRTDRLGLAQNHEANAKQGCNKCFVVFMDLEAGCHP